MKLRQGFRPPGPSMFHPTPITSFERPFAFLANDYRLRDRITMSGIVFPTAEHAFQAAKTLDLEARERIAAAPSPAAAREMGQRVGLRHDWRLVRLEVMRAVVEAKFLRCDFLMRRLLVTRTLAKDGALTNGNAYGDLFWGVDARTHAGFNHLGRILMALRDEMWAEIENPPPTTLTREDRHA